jgi:asparagine synthase (glutamine-hydrolysing)
MCGLVGFQSESEFQRLSEDLPAAILCLHNRGPDDSGLFFDQDSGVGLGHRRLAVLDLSAAGRQPMASEDGNVLIVHNGEIYNFREIRRKLEGYGHHFKSATDTEVILKAYIQWGIDCLNHFVGMFAFALWDAHEKRIFFARDRLGIKPLYYHFSSGTFLFSSELKALMKFRCFERNFDDESIPLYLHYQYVPAPRTIFKNTFKLLPGHYGVFERGDLKTRPYWQITESVFGSKRRDACEEDVLEELDRILTRSVSERLVSDVPLGALLSGGIDSSMVLSLMQKVNTSPVRTFSIGFKDQKYDEAPWASKIAKYLGTNHTELYVTPKEAMDVIPKLPEIYDEPFADPSAIPTFLVSRLARSHVTVALSGDGGDEQFCGYVRYWITEEMLTRFKRLPRSFKRLLAYSSGKIPSQFMERSYPVWSRFAPQRFQVANFPDKWQKLITMMEANSLLDLYRTTICLWSLNEVSLLTGRALPETIFEKTFQRSQGLPILSRLMRVDQMTYLPDAMLTKVDRASMAVSLEVRVPLLDHRVMEYISSLPVEFKYRNGEGKYIMKKLLARYVPAQLFERPKMGFAVPIDKWFRKELKELLLDYLSPESLKQEGLFDHNIVGQKIREHLSGRINHQYRIWALLMWEMWREKWLDG